MNMYEGLNIKELKENMKSMIALVHGNIASDEQKMKYCEHIAVMGLMVKEKERSFKCTTCKFLDYSQDEDYPGFVKCDVGMGHFDPEEMYTECDCYEDEREPLEEEMNPNG